MWRRVAYELSLIHILIYKSFDADPLVSDKMSRAISRCYGMYVDKPEWGDDEA